MRKSHSELCMWVVTNACASIETECLIRQSVAVPLVYRGFLHKALMQAAQKCESIVNIRVGIGRSQLNKAVCLLGVILIVFSVLIMTKSEIFTGQYENPPTPTQWEIQQEPINESPERYIAKYASIFPLTFMGGIVFLIGLTALIAGSQMSKK